MSTATLLARLSVFILAIAALAMATEQAARPLWPEAAGPTTKERIDTAFAAVRADAYEGVIVGNSRVYRGINPDRLGLRAYNFAQDDDACNQVFYKLEYLDTHGVRVGTVIMGVDYFQFSFLSDRRNFAYAPHFPASYLEDFPQAPIGLRRLAWLTLHPIDETAFNAFMVRYFTRPAALLVERGLAELRGEPPAPKVRTHVMANGQFVIDAPQGAVGPVKRDATRLPIQERYFDASLAWARRNHVRLILVMLPLRAIERDSYSPEVIEEFDRWLDGRAAEYGATYLNFSTHPAFGDRDFADETHLTTQAADRFSDLLGDAIRRLGDH